MSQYHKKFLRKMLAVSDPLTGETFIPKAKRIGTNKACIIHKYMKYKNLLPD